MSDDIFDKMYHMGGVIDLPYNEKWWSGGTNVNHGYQYACEEKLEVPRIYAAMDRTRRQKIMIVTTRFGNVVISEIYKRGENRRFYSVDFPVEFPGLLKALLMPNDYNIPPEMLRYVLGDPSSDADIGHVIEQMFGNQKNPTVAKSHDSGGDFIDQ